MRTCKAIPDTHLCTLCMMAILNILYACLFSYPQKLISFEIHVHILSQEIFCN